MVTFHKPLIILRNRCRNKRLNRIAVTIFTVPILMAAFTPPAAGAESGQPPVSNDQLPLSPDCRFVDIEVPSSVLNHQVVQLSLGSLAQPSQFKIHGRLCLPPGGAPKGIMLAVPGVTYNNQYWDVGYQPDRYSFARKMMDAGYGVLAYDELGTGHSSHPPGALVTWDVAAEVTHQLIQQLRKGDIGGQKYKRVILVGHSSGTVHAWMESAKYNDADAVIGTAWGSSVVVDPGRRFYSSFLQAPAPLDPKAASLVGADPTYFTTPPGGRRQNFLYDLSNVDQNVLAYDQNVLRDTASLGYIATTFNRFKKIFPGGYVPNSSEALAVPAYNPVLDRLVEKAAPKSVQSAMPSVQTDNIRIPVFQINGANDLFFCGPDAKYCNSSQSLQKEESQYFSPSARYRAAVIPNAGHDLNLQRNAPVTFDTIRQFADQVAGSGGTN